MKPEETRDPKNTVPFDRLAAALGRTRETRMLLYLLSASLPPDITTSEIDDALYDLERRVSEADREAMRATGIGQYYIVAPVSMLRPPDPDTMNKITSALVTLNDLGLLIETF